MKDLIEVKQDKEKSKYEVAILKQRLLYQHLPDSLNSLQLPLPSHSAFSSLDAIINLQSRQNLLDRYKNIIEQTKSKLMSFYIDIAEVKMQECQMKFDKTIVRMRPDQRSTMNTQRLSPPMLKLVEQRFKNIDERLEHLFNLKIRFLNEKTV